MAIVSVVFLFLSISAASSSVNGQLVFGRKRPETELLVAKPVMVEGRTVFTFNEDKKHKLVIDKVEVNFYSTEVTAVRIVNGGPGKRSLTLLMVPVGPVTHTDDGGVSIEVGEETAIGVMIYGHLSTKSGRIKQKKSKEEFKALMDHFTSMGIVAGASPELIDDEEVQVHYLKD